MQNLKNKPSSIICSAFRLSSRVGVILAILMTVFLGPMRPVYATTNSNDSGTVLEWKLFFPLVEKILFYVSPTGNDNNPGTQSKPWKTIKKATDTMVAGDKAIVLSGTYNEKVNISTSGIILQAEGKAITKGVYVSGNSNTFRGFTITDPTSDWGIRTTGNYNLIEGNEIYHTHQDGIWFFGTYNTFRGNYIHDILDPSVTYTHVDCFSTWGSNWDTTNILFENNICINNNMQPNMNQILDFGRTNARELRDITFRNNILVLYMPIYSGLNFWWETGWLHASNVTVVNNTLINMTSSMRAEGITFNNIDGVTAINNLFINFGDAHTSYINAVGGSNINVHNNAAYNTNGIPPKGGPYPGDVWMKDPMIVSLPSMDFHLQSNSPLIDTGYNLGNLVTDDFDRVTRPRGAGYDISAYEFPAP